MRFVAAQLPTGSILTSVACGPDSPRPKDCPGLGDPNTLKTVVVAAVQVIVMAMYGHRDGVNCHHNGQRGNALAANANMAAGSVHVRTTAAARVWPLQVTTFEAGGTALRERSEQKLE